MKSPLQFAGLLSLASSALACTGQGSGNCNLELFGVTTFGPGSFWQTATIFNNQCQKIGGVNHPHKGQAITSQLRWTVDLNHLENKKSTKIGMCYGSYCFEGDFACSQYYDGYQESLTCQHAFPC